MTRLIQQKHNALTGSGPIQLIARSNIATPERFGKTQVGYSYRGTMEDVADVNRSTLDPSYYKQADT